MTQHELTFAYHMEAMMGDIPTPEQRQLVVELLCIVATLMERNPEIYVSDPLNCDQVSRVDQLDSCYIQFTIVKS